MRHGSLFSGIGGFDLASEWMGWENVFHCEINPFCQKVLKYYWPEAISYDDITKTDFTIHRGQIDILTGGFPCQPYSTAGKRLGTADDRHLWPEMLRAIREIQPTWIVGENVRGLVNWNGGMVFNQVQTDLEDQGYEVIPFLLPACGVNAPHKRDRIFFVAKNTNKDGRGFEFGKEKSGERGFRNAGTGDNERVRTNYEKIIADSGGQHSDIPIQQRGQDKAQNININRPIKIGITPNTNNKRIQRGPSSGHIKKEGENGKQLFRGYHKPTNWHMFPTQSPVCGGDDGLPNELDGITFSNWRKESLMGFGNAVVPQLVYQIFKSL